MGKIHLYIGDGKGKTTAAVGLACRHVGTGGRVLFVQFMKEGWSSEVSELKKLGVVCHSFGRKGFLTSPTSEDIALANEGISFVTLEAGKYDMVVLDEVLTASGKGLINPAEILRLCGCNFELVLTGRNAPKELIEIADYVSEIKKIKHPFDKGLEARKGIEF